MVPFLVAPVGNAVKHFFLGNVLVWMGLVLGCQKVDVDMGFRAAIFIPQPALSSDRGSSPSDAALAP